jgi:beta-lactam-binding protein with PASTA domain
MAAAPQGGVSAQDPKLTTLAQTTVPDLIGSTLAAAMERLTAARLRPGKVDTTYGGDRARSGTVIEQSLAAKTSAGVGQAVSLRIGIYRSSASPTAGEMQGVQVPELSKLDIRAAQESLRVRRLLLTGVTEADAFTVPAGIVLGQKPSAGDWVRPGSGVAVSIASDTTEVPSLLRLRPNQVSDVLALRRLVTGESRVVQSEAQEGTIIDQRPVPGQRVPKGSTVSISVATALLVPVPELRGLNVSSALPAIRDGRLRRGGLEERDRFDVPTGTVLDQRPLPGEAVRVGSPINLTVASVWTEVPSLAQADTNRIRGLLARYQLVPGEFSSIQSEAREGAVVGQQPEAGRHVRKGSTVSVSVATPVLVPVPNLLGIGLAAAESTLTGARLRRGGLEERDRFDLATGTVLDQQPPAGAQVRVGSPVDLSVASAWTEVPSLDRVDPNQVGPLLVRYQLVVGGLRSIQSEALEGSIVGQQPAAGQRVPKGSQVSIDVAGPVPVQVQVPDLRGLVPAAAESAVAGAGLRRGNLAERDQFDAATGTVLEQRPAAGTLVPLGSDVSLWVASDWTEVPSLDGMDGNEAESALARYQLVPGEGRSVQSDEPEGAIVGQVPAAGQRVRKGTTVSFDIAEAGIPPWLYVLLGIAAVYALLAVGSPGLRPAAVLALLHRNPRPPPPPPPPPEPPPPPLRPDITFEPETRSVTAQLLTPSLASLHALELAGVLEPAASDYGLRYSGTLTAGGEDGH